MGGDISTRLENHIEAYARLADAEIRQVLERIGRDAETVAKATLGTSHHGDDSIHRKIRRLRVTHDGGIWETGVGAGDWKSNFFEKGTHAHSTAPKARRVYSLTKSGARRRKRGEHDSYPFVSGVEAYHYLRTGIRTASASLSAQLAAGLARIRV